MEMCQKKIFSERLGLLRTEAGLSQQQLSDKTGIVRETIAKYETAKRIPSYNDLTTLAKHFDTTTDYLLGLSEVKTLDTNLRGICEYTGLSEKSIKAIQKYENDFFSLKFINDLLETQLEDDGLLLAIERYCFYKPLEADFIISKYSSIRPVGIYDEMQEDDLVRISSSQIVEQVIFSDICDKLKALKNICGGYGERYWNMLKEELNNGQHNPKKE